MHGTLEIHVRKIKFDNATHLDCLLISLKNNNCLFLLKITVFEWVEMRVMVK